MEFEGFVFVLPKRDIKKARFAGLEFSAVRKLTLFLAVFLPNTFFK